MFRNQGTKRREIENRNLISSITDRLEHKEDRNTKRNILFFLKTHNMEELMNVSLDFSLNFDSIQLRKR